MLKVKGIRTLVGEGGDPTLQGFIVFKPLRMGYTTQFKGELLFTTDVTQKELALIKTFFGEDLREHPEWQGRAQGSYIDLRFNELFTGIEWDDETEKNHGIVSHINLIIEEVQKINPDFGLKGEMVAQGEDLDDRWRIVIENGIAVKKEIPASGDKVICPHCGEEFRV